MLYDCCLFLLCKKINNLLLTWPGVWTHVKNWLLSNKMLITFFYRLNILSEQRYSCWHFQMMFVGCFNVNVLACFLVCNWIRKDCESWFIFLVKYLWPQLNIPVKAFIGSAMDSYPALLPLIIPSRLISEYVRAFVCERNEWAGNPIDFLKGLQVKVCMQVLT